MQTIATIDQYSTGRDTRVERDAPHIDRARGGTVSVTLIIPAKRIQVQGGKGGFVDIPKEEVTFTIDMEQLPLVNVARYQTTMTQIAPEVIPYPDAKANGAAPLTHTFG
jgi:hypothetical protein